MKIIIGSESFAPNVSGVAVTTERLAESLADRGHEVYVFAPSRSFRSAYDSTFKKYKVYRLRSVINPFRSGFRVSLKPAAVVEKQVAGIKPDLIHLQDPTSICGALLKSAKRHHIPVIITNHFSLEYVISYLRLLTPLHGSIRKFLMHHLAKFYNECNYVLCPTETVKKELLRWGVKTEIEAVSNGVDVDRFYSYSLPVTIRMKYHLPANPIVLYMGRIDKDKNIETLVQAIPKVLKHVNAHFVFAGSGGEVDKMEKLVEKMKIRRQVSFIGWIDHNSQDLPELYQMASLFAIPSTIETQSLVTLEAMAAGLPVVAANAGALPELVKPNENGFLFPPHNADALGEAIVKILTDERLAQKMGKKSLEIVADHTLAECYTKIEKVYENVVKTAAEKAS